MAEPQRSPSRCRENWGFADHETVLEGIRQIVPAGTEVTYVKGCEVIGQGADEIEKAKQAAVRADVAVVLVGEASQI